MNMMLKRIKQTEIGDVLISTIEIDMPAEWGLAPLSWRYETMVFGGVHNQQQWRTSNKAVALAQHEEACALVKGEMH
jgi:hypothetical protein